MAYDAKIKAFSGADPKFYAERRLANRSARLVNAVKDLKGIRLELCGYCLRVTGSTYAHKEKLIDLKFKWDYKGKYWYKAMTFTRAD